MRKKRGVRRHISFELLKDHVVILYGLDAKALDRELCNATGYNKTTSQDGRYIELESLTGDIIRYIWTRYRKPSILAHEAIHCARAILFQRAIDSEEMEAYLVEAIVRQVAE